MDQTWFPIRCHHHIIQLLQLYRYVNISDEGQTSIKINIAILKPRRYSKLYLVMIMDAVRIIFSIFPRLFLASAQYKRIIMMFSHQKSTNGHRLSTPVQVWILLKRTDKKFDYTRFKHYCFDILTNIVYNGKKYQCIQKGRLATPQKIIPSINYNYKYYCPLDNLNVLISLFYQRSFK